MTPSAWGNAAKQAAREMPNASLDELEERAQQILAEQTTAVEKEKQTDPHPRSPRLQHAAGHMVPDHREIGRRLMVNAGVDPDAPLNIDWHRERDLRPKVDQIELGMLLLMHRQSMPDEPLSSVADMVAAEIK